MAQSGVYVPFRYDGDSTFDGFVYLTDSSVDIIDIQWVVLTIHLIWNI